MIFSWFIRVLRPKTFTLYVVANVTLTGASLIMHLNSITAKKRSTIKADKLMVSLMILKYLRNLTDESPVEQHSENCYYQFFGGGLYFRPEIPCVPPAGCLSLSHR